MTETSEMTFESLCQQHPHLKEFETDIIYHARHLMRHGIYDANQFFKATVEPGMNFRVGSKCPVRIAKDLRSDEVEDCVYDYFDSHPKLLTPEMIPKVHVIAWLVRPDLQHKINDFLEASVLRLLDLQVSDSMATIIYIPYPE